MLASYMTCLFFSKQFLTFLRLDSSVNASTFANDTEKKSVRISICQMKILRDLHSMYC